MPSINDIELDVMVLMCCLETSSTKAIYDIGNSLSFEQLDGADAEMCSVVVEPHTALLGPRENVQLAVHFTAHKRVSNFSPRVIFFMIQKMPCASSLPKMLMSAFIDCALILNNKNYVLYSRPLLLGTPLSFVGSRLTR